MTATACTISPIIFWIYLPVVAVYSNYDLVYPKPCSVDQAPEIENLSRPPSAEATEIVSQSDFAGGQIPILRKVVFRGFTLRFYVV